MTDKHTPGPPMTPQTPEQIAGKASSMTDKHTPGPWFVMKRGSEWQILGRPTWGCTYLGKKGRWAVATLDEMIIDDYPKEAEANAHLIASAPDMATRITALEAREAELVEALVVAAIPLEAIIMSGADAAHCQDVRDAIHDAVQTIRATLAKHQEGEG